MLPLLRIGDMVRGTRIEGALRQREITLTLDHASEVTAAGIFDEAAPPPDWSGTYRTLNRFEYELGTHREVSGSRCLRIQQGRAEFLIPCSVILKTFYGFHTKLANAICSGPWEARLADVISTAQYKSGIGTNVDAKTGAWNIVVQNGLRRAHAVRLAALYFDAHARRCANAVHARATAQTHATRADGERYWFADARIPYRWDTLPFTLRVRALPLRPHRPSAAQTPRFLVTSIDATSWPFPEQEIFSELANSSTSSADPDPEKVNEPYFKEKPNPVIADDDAQLDHENDAFKGSPDNQVDADDFQFLNPPRHHLQLKSSHQEYQGSVHTPALAPAAILSAGLQAPGDTKPAPLSAESRDRRLAPQLRLLLNALDALLEEGEIEGFEIISPPTDSHLRQVRMGIACWSFVTEDQLRTVLSGRAARGWEFIFDPPRTPGGPRRPTPRCLLVVKVQLDGLNLLLFEVEPRLRETAYRTYLVVLEGNIDWAAIENALAVLRGCHGRLRARDLNAAFAGLSRRRAIAVNHGYERDAGHDINALTTASLRRALIRACDQPLAAVPVLD